MYVGKLNTPILDEEESHELIRPAFDTPQGEEVPVIGLAWQVEGKLAAWISRRKTSDFDDLVFLCGAYGDTIREWSQHLNLDFRQQFYEVYTLVQNDAKILERTKQILSL